LSAVIAVLVIGIAGMAFAGSLERRRGLAWSATATDLLAERMDRLAELELPSLPSPGVYGPTASLGGLTPLLVPEGPLSFRLEVAAVDRAPRDFARFRLTCSWLDGSCDVVVMRGRAPIARKRRKP